MPVTITGNDLTIEDVVRVARCDEPVELHPDVRGRVDHCRGFLNQRIEAREIMYGVNTGIGEFSEVVLTDEQTEQFQRYLIYNHAAGIGEPAPIEHVRAAMVSRLNVHAKGYSGCRFEITRTLLEMLNRGVTPVVCEKGSVGACGDLSSMSQIALLMMGEGEALYRGERLPGREALDRAGIPVPGLQARDGLATINGSNLTAGMACLELYDAERWLKQADIATAMTLEALNANLKLYDGRLHELRGFAGAVASAANIMRCIEGSDLLKGRRTRVQDAYSMRSSPQMTGAARDQLRWARSQLEIELNGVGDNPIFGITSALRRALSGAGIGGKLRPHDLRHRTASHLVRAGVDLETVRRIGGWASLEMVQRYVHADEDQMVDAVSRLSSMATAAAAASLPDTGTATAWER